MRAHDSGFVGIYSKAYGLQQVYKLLQFGL